MKQTTEMNQFQNSAPKTVPKEDQALKEASEKHRKTAGLQRIFEKRQTPRSLPRIIIVTQSNAAALDDRTEGLKKDLDIHEKPEIFDVADLALLSFSALIGEGVSTGYLPQSRDTRTDGKQSVPIIPKEVGLIQCQGTGSHKAHLPGKDIEKLGKLVNTEFSNEPADPGYSWVILHLKFRIEFLKLFRRKVFFKLMGIVSHGAELDYSEGLPVLSYPLLKIEGGMEVRYVDQCRKDEKERKKYQERQECEYKIQCRLHSHVKT